MIIRILLWVVLAAISAKAQEPLVLPEASESVIPMGTRVYFWEDPSNAADLPVVLSDSVQTKFKKSEQEILAFGLSSSTYWLKIPLRFEEESARQRWILELTLASYSAISFFEQRDGVWQEVATGATKPFVTRPIQYRFFAFPLTAPNTTEATYYVKIKSHRALTLPLMLYRQDRFISKVIREEWLYGAFIGVLFFVAGYNFLLYFSLHERSYLFCSSYVFLSAVILTIYNGYLFQFVFPEASVNPAVLQTYATLLQRWFVVAFTISFLGVTPRNGFIYYTLAGLLMALVALGVCMPIAGLDAITPWQLLLSLCTLGFTTWTGFYFLYKGVKQARFLAVGYLLYTLGVLYNNLLFFRLTVPNFFTIHGPEIGIFLEAIFLTFALGDKYRFERQSSTEELKATVTNLARQNEDLEQFSFVVSHNLRAPVARILGLVNVFKADPKAHIEDHLTKTAHDLDEVIRDLTQIVSIRKNVNTLREQVDLPALIEKEIGLLEDSLKEANGKYVVHNGVSHVNAIAVYLRSILNNLLSNAIKYRNPEVPLRITVRTWMNQSEVGISVQDNGLGIRAQELGKVFQLYQRFHDHVEGRGLGLYLVKTQAMAMNGRVEVTSTPGEGSTFTVYFPAIAPG